MASYISDQDRGIASSGRLRKSAQIARVHSTAARSKSLKTDRRSRNATFSKYTTLSAFHRPLRRSASIESFWISILAGLNPYRSENRGIQICKAQEICVGLARKASRGCPSGRVDIWDSIHIRRQRRER